MTSTKQEIINDIDGHIKKEGGGYKTWYVGISKDAKDRLFNGHSVKEQGDWWVYRQATSSSAAREIEKYFLEVKGTDGGPGGGENDADYVYAYKKTAHSRE